MAHGLEALGRHAQRAGCSAVRLVYCAGHGMRVHGRNYFNFDKAGNPYPTVSNFDLRSVARYFNAGASWGGSFTPPCNTIAAEQVVRYKQ